MEIRCRLAPHPTPQTHPPQLLRPRRSQPVSSLPSTPRAPSEVSIVPVAKKSRLRSAQPHPVPTGAPIPCHPWREPWSRRPALALAPPSANQASLGNRPEIEDLRSSTSRRRVTIRRTSPTHRQACLLVFFHRWTSGPVRRLEQHSLAFVAVSLWILAGNL